MKTCLPLSRGGSCKKYKWTVIEMSGHAQVDGPSKSARQFASKWTFICIADDSGRYQRATFLAKMDGLEVFRWTVQKYEKSWSKILNSKSGRSKSI